MKKRLLSFALALLLLIGLLASCDDAEKGLESEPSEKDPKTVSAAEWKRAFQFTDSPLFSMEIDEMSVWNEGNESHGIKGTAEVDVRGMIAHYDLIEYLNGRETPLQQSMELEEFEDVSAVIVPDVAEEFLDALKDEDDWCYGKFTYDSEGSVYRATMEITRRLCDVEIFFEDGRLMKFSVVENESESAERDIRCVYTFTYR